MPRIYVAFSDLKQIGSCCKTVSSRVDSIQSDFQRTMRQLDWDVKYEDNINSTAKKIAGQLDGYASALKQFQRFIDNAHREYSALDMFNFDSDSLNIASLAEDFAPPSCANNKDENQDDADQQFSSWLESLLMWKDKTDTDDTGTSGVSSRGISYISSLQKFFAGDMSGFSGAKDWFNLGDKSVGLWSAFYDYLKTFYNESGEIFSKGAQTKVAGLDLVGSILGFISSACGTADTLSSENMGTAGTIGELFGLSKDAANIWIDIDALNNIGSADKTGIYSPTSLYATIAKSYLSAIGQGFTSYEKYSADGSWDLGDTSATAIDSATSGLYAMVDALTFGLISEDSTGVSADEISDAIKNWGSDVGTRAGKNIANNPAVYQLYQNSDIVTKVFITFCAAIAP